MADNIPTDPNEIKKIREINKIYDYHITTSPIIENRIRDRSRKKSVIPLISGIIISITITLMLFRKK